MRIKKPILTVISIIIVLSLLPISAFMVSAASYDPNKAISYASQHWNDGVGACATFVSNCLQAGGCSAWSSGVGTLREALINGGWGTQYELKRDANHSYSIKESDNIGKLSYGDPIIFYCKKCSKPWVHVMICSGFDSSGYAKAYAHNAAKNNERIYNYNDGNHSGSDIVAYSIHMQSNPISTVTIESLASKNTIEETNAILWAQVNKPSSYAVTEIGIYVRKANDTYANGWSKFEAPSRSYIGDTYMRPYYNLNGELGLTLSPGTEYCYQFYAVVNGNECWGPEETFKTKGDAPIYVPYYYINVNGILDGDLSDSIQNYGTFDVYVNGDLVANDVNDYYVKWPEGTTYEIKDIKASNGKVFVQNDSSALIGTLFNTGFIQLCFNTYPEKPQIEVEVVGNEIYVWWNNCDKADRYNVYLTYYMTEEDYISLGGDPETYAASVWVAENEKLNLESCYAHFAAKKNTANTFLSYRIKVEAINSITGAKTLAFSEPINIIFIRGDINGDGAVNNKDLTRLFQYLSDWEVNVNEPALDINGDGMVNNKDLTRLFQYLSDWNVEIF